MSIKIVAWNMNNWARKSTERVAAWKYLRTTLAPDVALLQETAPPVTDPPPNLIYHEIESRNWGTAVASYSWPSDEITSAKSPYCKDEAPLLITAPGALVITRMSTPSGQSITCVSMYGLHSYGYALNTVHKLLSDITPLVDSPLGKYLIVGGDLNIGTQFQASDRHLSRHANVLERFGALGLVDCVDQKLPADRGRLIDCPCIYGEDCRHVRTQRHKRMPQIPYQTDYIFASKALAKKLTAAETWDKEEAWSLSDHCPIVATFDI